MVCLFLKADEIRTEMETMFLKNLIEDTMPGLFSKNLEKKLNQLVKKMYHALDVSISVKHENRQAKFFYELNDLASTGNLKSKSIEKIEFQFRE